MISILGTGSLSNSLQHFSHEFYAYWGDCCCDLNKMELNWIWSSSYLNTLYKFVSHKVTCPLVLRSWFLKRAKMETLAEGFMSGLTNGWCHCGYIHPMNTLETGANRTTGNEQQSAPEAFSQPCLYCLKDILCLLLLECLHTLREKNILHRAECFYSFSFHNLSRVQDTSPVVWLPWPPGISAHMVRGLTEAFF